MNGGHGRGRLGENSPFARDRPEVSPQVGAALDPIALEDRLRVAREQRAEALARRQASVRPRPAAPAPRQALRAPAPDPVDAAPPTPSLSVRRPRAAAPVHEAPPPARLAHPLVALLAAGLTTAFVMSHRAPVAPPADPVVAEATPATPTPGPPATDLAAPPAPTPVVVRDAGPVQSAPAEPLQAAAVPADPGPADPLPAAPIPPGAVPAAKDADAPALAAAEPPVAAPRTQRILVNAPSGAPTEATLAALRASGFDAVAVQPTRLTIRSSSVRYYHAADAAAAAEVAALIAPGLPGGVAEARDFSDAPSRGAPGHLEIWIASAPARAAAPGPAPAPAPAGAAGVDPDQIRQLVESVFSPRSLDNLGRGAATVARDIESGAGAVAQGLDAAIGGAVRLLEGR